MTLYILILVQFFIENHINSSNNTHDYYNLTSNMLINKNLLLELKRRNRYNLSLN